MKISDIRTLKGKVCNNAMGGPTASAHNYIAHIALPNFIEYWNLEEQKCEGESSPVKYTRFRKYLNAVESFNN